MADSLAARDAALTQEIIEPHLILGSDPYIHRRAWEGQVELGLESEGQGV